jgi:hypothetical protein
MKPDTPIVLAVATSQGRRRAVHGSDNVQGARRESEFDHVVLPAVTRDPDGKLGHNEGIAERAVGRRTGARALLLVTHIAAFGRGRCGGLLHDESRGTEGLAGRVGAGLAAQVQDRAARGAVSRLRGDPLRKAPFGAAHTTFNDLYSTAGPSVATGRGAETR